MQVKLPSLLTQISLSIQECDPMTHSLISGNKVIHYGKECPGKSYVCINPLININMLTLRHLPLQTPPTLSYPYLQRQEKEPILFMHFSLVVQL